MPPPDQDNHDHGPPSAGNPSQAASRFLSALLATAEQQRVSALVDVVKPPVTVVTLPELRANVLVLEREDVDAATLSQRLNHLMAVPTQAVVHLVLVGGSAADRPLLVEADRAARNPNRLGVWHLQVDDGGQLTHVAGRKLALLPRAMKRLSTAPLLDAQAIAAAAVRGRAAQEEAMAFSVQLQARRPLATWILCGVNAVMFLLETQWGRASTLLEAQVLMGANHQGLVASGEYWRLLSHAFLHGSGLHLGVNLIGLFSFGGFLERLIGWRRYLVLYAAAALAGGVASAFIGEPHVSLGASGAIWGLMAAGFALVRPGQALLPALMSQQLRRQLVPILVINIAFSFYPGIDKFAHFGGGLMGLALAAGWLTRGLPAAQAGASLPPDPWPLRIAAGLAIALMVASVAAALLIGQPWHPRGLFAADPGRETAL